MRATQILFVILILLLTSCKTDDGYEPEGLRKMTKSEVISNAKNGIVMDFNDLIFKDQLGKTISEDSLEKIKTDKTFTADIYLDKNDKPNIGIVRKATDTDRELNSELLAIY